MMSTKAEQTIIKEVEGNPVSTKTEVDRSDMWYFSQGKDVIFMRSAYHLSKKYLHVILLSRGLLSKNQPMGINYPIRDASEYQPVFCVEQSCNVVSIDLPQ